MTTAAVSYQGAEDILRKSVLGRKTVMIWGPPGVGKTSLVRQVCDELGFLLLEESAACIPYEELGGYPRPHPDGNRIENLVPAWLTPALTVPCVVFIDDLPDSHRMTQSALFRFLLDRRIGAHDLSNNVRTVICAGNPTQSNAMSVTLPPALRTRFRAHIYLEPSAEEWRSNFARFCASPVARAELERLWLVIAAGYVPMYVSERPLTDTYPCPRTWQAAAEWYAEGMPRDKAVAIATGPVVASTVHKILKNTNRTAAEILDAPETATEANLYYILSRHGYVPKDPTKLEELLERFGPQVTEEPR